MLEREEVRVKKVIAGIIKENAAPKDDGSIIIPPLYYHSLVDGLFVFYDLREKALTKKIRDEKD